VKLNSLFEEGSLSEARKWQAVGKEVQLLCVAIAPGLLGLSKAFVNR
jgi:hypothetical protein